MSEFMSLLKTAMTCGTVFLVVFVILLSLPQSRMRSVCLEIAKYVIAGALALLTVSPIDVVPDFLFPIGFVDDLVYIVGAICAVRSGLHERKARAQLPE